MIKIPQEVFNIVNNHFSGDAHYLESYIKDVYTFGTDKKISLTDLYNFNKIVDVVRVQGLEYDCIGIEFIYPKSEKTKEVITQDRETLLNEIDLQLKYALDVPFMLPMETTVALKNCQELTKKLRVL